MTGVGVRSVLRKVVLKFMVGPVLVYLVSQQF